MADAQGGGNWLLVQELFDRSEPGFVDELRKITEADRLGPFAERWYHDRRPTARRFLLEYLERPLNAYRHEVLVKRLFKLAEKAGDDEAMARFLVLFDRSVRRRFAKRSHYESRTVKGSEQAEALRASWEAQGFTSVGAWPAIGDRFRVSGSWTEEFLRTPRNTVMPRGKMVQVFDYGTWDPLKRSYPTYLVPDWAVKLKLAPQGFREMRQIPEDYRKQLERFRLFTTPTRKYLRRRAWRYFRRLGKRQPERYVAAVSQALLRYQDQDAADGLALIDNWSLIHILFHYSPVLEAKPNGWLTKEGRSLAELEPAPIYEPLWKATPRAVVELMIRARCRPVRQWAMQLAQRDPAAILAVTPLEELLSLLGHEDPDVAALAAELLRNAKGLDDLPLDRWLTLAETPNPEALEILCELMERHLQPERVTLAQAARLAGKRPLPLVRLGLSLLRTKRPGDESDYRALLGLTEAEAEPLRPEIVSWVRTVISEAAEFRPEWLLEFLDSRHPDVRAEGLAWFRDEPRSRDDVVFWQRLLESPYDDVRLALVAELETRVAGRQLSQTFKQAIDDDLLRLLWASVLLNVHRGSRAKPLVVRQIVRHLEAWPGESDRLLPLLSVALRSVRGPERRAGLAAVVQLAERDAGSVQQVRAAFPELHWS